MCTISRNYLFLPSASETPCGLSHTAGCRSRTGGEWNWAELTDAASTGKRQEKDRARAITEGSR